MQRTRRQRLRDAVKRYSIMSGLYRPARYVNDLFFTRVNRSRLARDKKFYRSILNPGDQCFDVGANIGTKSLAMLSAGASVVAFEPQPDCVKELVSRCRKYRRRLRVVPAALGGRDEHRKLFVSDLPNMSSFRDDWEQVGSAGIDVPVLTLDSAIREFGKPRYCKIDVEGWEMEVLKGLSTPLPLVSFEFHLRPGEPERAMQCIEHLKRLAFGRIELNLCGPEDPSFLLDDWVSFERFAEIFPEEVRAVAGVRYGDVWVRSQIEE